MHAVLVEVNANESHIEEARRFLADEAVPMARQHGAQGGYWLAPFDGRGVMVTVYATEDEAKAVAARFTVGEPAMPGAPKGTSVRSVEVREVLASL